MRKVLAIGRDALDPVLLSRFKPDLPHFRKLMADSPKIRLKSIFPPDTVPAWITIFTGLNPAKHGLVYSFDVFESQWQDIINIDIDTFRGRTFWDIASKFGI